MQKYPNAKISSLSNSATQKIFIDAEAKKRGLSNITVYTGDVNEYEFPDSIKYVESLWHSSCLLLS